jgi:hypothetical protein
LELRAEEIIANMGMSSISPASSERRSTIFVPEFVSESIQLTNQPSQHHIPQSSHDEHGDSGNNVDRLKRPALAEISPANSKRTNGGIQVAVTPNENEIASKFPGLYYCSYLPIQAREQCFRSQVHWRWRQKEGIKLDKDFYWVIHNDMAKPKSSRKKSDGISLDLLGTLLWALLAFLYPSRRGKKKAMALVDCVFTVLAKNYPEYFEQALLVSSRKFCRTRVTMAYKLQRTIDTQPTGGLNLGCIDSLQKGIEELEKRSQGFLPSGSTVALCAKQLESHAVAEYGFYIHKVDTRHGPVYSFDIPNLIWKVCQAFSLEQYAVTGSTAAPVQLTYTMDGAQLTNDLGHVTGGIKVVDTRAVDPTTGIPLAATGNFQSRDFSFVAQIAFVKDSKQTYKDCFQEFLSIFHQQQFVIPASGINPE